jgi:peptidoglycan/xylan/chitin deacetylase (PgdA/CDA1 family)
MMSFKALARSAFCAAYKFSGAAALQEQWARRSGRRFSVILLFHRVTDAIPEDGLTVGTARFRRICALLKRSFHVVPLADVFAAQRAGRPLPPRTVAVTFDDCYHDNVVAAQVLREHGLPATFFVPTGYVGTNKVFPWDRRLPRLPNLTWDDLRAMAEQGFEIGSHTVNHPDLGALSHDQARRELVESAAAIEDHVGRRARFLAYPFGGPDNFRPDLFPLVEEAGYQGCVSAYGGFVWPDADVRLLPREAVPYFTSVLHLELHLRGILGWAYGLLRRLGLNAGPRNGSVSLAAEHDGQNEVVSAAAL